jgi:hypothetical protein
VSVSPTFSFVQIRSFQLFVLSVYVYGFPLLSQSTLYATCIFEKKTTVSFVDLDLCSKIIIFKPILTTFEGALFSEAATAEAKICSSLKSNHHQQIQLAKSIKYSAHKSLIHERYCNVYAVPAV